MLILLTSNNTSINSNDNVYSAVTKGSLLQEFTRFIQCRLSAKWPPTLRPSHPT